MPRPLGSVASMRSIPQQRYFQDLRTGLFQQGAVRAEIRGLGRATACVVQDSMWDRGDRGGRGSRSLD